MNDGRYVNDLTRRSRLRVDDLLVSLAVEYGPFGVRELDWEVAPDDHDQLRERFEAQGNGGAGVWITNDAGEVLLVRHESEQSWSDPGGKREPGETFAEAALREVNEESSVECAITGVLETHVVSHHAEDRPMFVSPIVIFSGNYRDGEPTPREGEIADVRWWGQHPERVRYPAIEEFPIPASE